MDRQTGGVMKKKGLIRVDLVCCLLCCVADTHGEVQPSCPRYVSEGQMLSCTCTYQTQTPPPDTPLLSWPGHSNTAVLELPSVQRADNGSQFTCQVTMGGQRDTAVYVLQVAYGPSQVNITYPEPLPAGDKVTLTCTATDVNPQPTFSWTGVTCDNGNQDDTCTLNSTLLGDSGRTVTCEAYNRYVQPGGLRLQTAVSLNGTSEFYPPPGPPEVLGKDEGRPLATGDNLTCTVKGGNPLVTMLLFHCDNPTLVDQSDVFTDTAVTSTLVVDTALATSPTMDCVCTALWAHNPDMYTDSSVVVRVPVQYTPPPTSPVSITTTSTPATTPTSTSTAPTSTMTTTTTPTTTTTTTAATGSTHAVQSTSSESTTGTPTAPVPLPPTTSLPATTPSDTTTATATTIATSLAATTTATTIATSPAATAATATATAITTSPAATAATATATAATATTTTIATSPAATAATAATATSTATATTPAAAATATTTTTTPTGSTDGTTDYQFPIAAFGGALGGAALLIFLIIIIVAVCRRKKERDVRLVGAGKHVNGSYKNVYDEEAYAFHNKAYSTDGGMSEVVKTDKHNTGSAPSENTPSARTEAMERALGFYNTVPVDTDETKVSVENDAPRAVGDVGDGVVDVANNVAYTSLPEEQTISQTPLSQQTIMEVPTSAEDNNTDDNEDTTMDTSDPVNKPIAPPESNGDPEPASEPDLEPDLSTETPGDTYAVVWKPSRTIEEEEGTKMADENKGDKPLDNTVTVYVPSLSKGTRETADKSIADTDSRDQTASISFHDDSD